MKKIMLPAIVEEAKKRPLSYNPRTNRFIYYELVETGDQKIFPVDKLSEDQLLKLAVERQLTNASSVTRSLNGDAYTNEQVAREMLAKSKIGQQLFKADIDYLKFYLLHFPKESFEKE